MWINNEQRVVQGRSVETRRKITGGGWISLLLQCLWKGLDVCALAPAGAQGNTRQKASWVVAELHTPPNLFSLKFHWTACWINTNPAGNPLKSSRFSVKMQRENMVRRGSPEHCLVDCDPAWCQDICWQGWWKTRRAVCRELLSCQSQSYYLLRVIAISLLKQGHWQKSPIFLCVSSHSSAAWKRLGLPSLHALAWLTPLKTFSLCTEGGRVCCVVLFCLHGCILQSQNNSAQLTASIVCWRVLRHCLVPRAEPDTAQHRLDLVFSPDIAIMSNHLQRSDRQSIWAKL